MPAWACIMAGQPGLRAFRDSQLPHQTDESSQPTGVNKRQKYTRFCSSFRIEYIHPGPPARTWLDGENSPLSRQICDVLLANVD